MGLSAQDPDILRHKNKEKSLRIAAKKVGLGIMLCGVLVCVGVCVMRSAVCVQCVCVCVCLCVCDAKCSVCALCVIAFVCVTACVDVVELGSILGLEGPTDAPRLTKAALQRTPQPGWAHRGQAPGVGRRGRHRLGKQIRAHRSLPGEPAVFGGKRWRPIPRRWGMGRMAGDGVVGGDV